MFGPEQFYKIARGFVPEFPLVKPCPSRWAGQIEDAGTEKRWEIEGASGPRLILIMESPHIAEYPDSVVTALEEPRGPALGATGRNLKHLARLIEKGAGMDPIPRGSNVILVNAIEFPCSLLRKPVEFRTRVFNACWRAEARDDFIARMRKLHKKDDFVLNACTKGKTSGTESLRDDVSEAIDEAIQGGTHWQISHPSSWRGNAAKTRGPVRWSRARREGVKE